MRLRAHILCQLLGLHARPLDPVPHGPSWEGTCPRCGCWLLQDPSGEWFGICDQKARWGEHREAH